MPVTQEDLLINVEANTRDASVTLGKLTGSLDEVKAQLAAMGKNAEATKKTLTDFGFANVKVAGLLNNVERAARLARKAFMGLFGDAQFEAAATQAKKLLQEIGMALSEGFGQDLGDAIVDGLKAMRSMFQQIKPDIVAATEAIRAFFSAAIQSLQQTDWESVATSVRNLAFAFVALGLAIKGAEIYAAIKAIGGLTAAIAAMGGLTGIMAQLTAFFAGSTFLASAKAIAIMSAKFLAMAAALLVIGAGIDIVVRNFSRFDKLMAVVGGAVEGTINKIGQGFRALFAEINGGILFVTKGLNKLGVVGDDAVVDRMQAVQKMTAELADLKGQQAEIGETLSDAMSGIDTGLAGQAIDFVTNFKDGLAEANAAAGKFKPSFKPGLDAIKDADAAMKDLTKLVNDLGVKNAAIGASEYDIIRQNTAEQMKQVAELERRIAAGGKLGEQAKKALDAARELAKIGGQKELDQSRLGALEEISEKNKELDAARMADGLNEQQMIDHNLDLALQAIEEIERKTEEADTQAMGALQERKRLLIEQAKLAKANASGEAMQGGKQLGEDVGKPIRKAIENSFAGAIAGFASGIGAAMSAVQAVIDAGPALLDQAAGIVNSLTDLPSKLAASVDGLFDALDRFVAEFIPRLLQGVEKILERIISFVETLPDIFANLLAKLPEMLTHLLDRIPEFAERLITAMIVLVPELAVALINFLVMEAPRIAWRMVVVLATELPKAIIKGIINGLKGAGKALGGLFKDVKLDGASLKKQMQGLGQQITGEASKLFAVLDVQDAAKRAEQAQQFVDAIEDAGDSLVDKLRSIWQWIMDKIITPLVNALRAVWLWVLEHIIMPLFNAVKAAWLWVYNEIILPLLTIGEKAFRWVLEHIITPLIGIGEKAFKWVFEHVITPLLTAGRTAFSWVLDYVVTPLLTVGEKIAAPIKAAFDGILGFFQGIGNALKSLFTFDFAGFAASIKDAFRAAGEALAEVFRRIVNPILTMLNSLKIPGVELTIKTPKGMKDIHLRLWDDIDLIPGDIPHFQSGGEIPGVGSGDRTLGMFEPGEFVMTRSGAEAIGKDILAAANRGTLTGNMMGMGGGTQQPNVTYNVSVNVPAVVPEDSWVRSKLVPKVKDELRRASLAGEFIIGASGVRSST